MKGFAVSQSSLRHHFEILSLSIVAGKIHHLEAHFNNYQEHCLLSPYYLPGTALSAFVILETSVSLKGVPQCGQEHGGSVWLVPWSVRLERQRLWVVAFA